MAGIGILAHWFIWFIGGLREVVSLSELWLRLDPEGLSGWRGWDGTLSILRSIWSPWASGFFLAGRQAGRIYTSAALSVC